MRFVISDELFEKLPDVCFGAVMAYGIQRPNEISEIEEMLKAETANLRKKLEGVELKESTYFMPYRMAFLKFGINPNKYMSSIEALSKRVVKGNDMPLINPAVDIGNIVSLRHVLPIGAHDVDALEGDISVRFAVKGDLFTPLGTEETEEVDEGELIYADSKRVRTRRWIWRQSDAGKITDVSKNIFFPIDGFVSYNKDEVISAVNDLSSILKKHLKCRTTEYFLDKDIREITL